MIIWQCTKCNKNLDGNPNFCPQCGHTVYRPVGRTDDLPRDTPKNDPIADRRQRALEVFYDASGPAGESERPEAAIEVATQVKITDDIVRSAYGLIDPREMARVMFAAAGFEVVE